MKKLMPIPSWQQMQLPSRITLFAGILTVIYAPLALFLSNHTLEKNKQMRINAQFILSTIIAFVITFFVALQVNCMLTGGCALAAWAGAVTATIAAYLYIRYVDVSIKSGQGIDNTIPDNLRIDNTTPYVQLNSLLIAQ